MNESFLSSLKTPNLGIGYPIHNYYPASKPSSPSLKLFRGIQSPFISNANSILSHESHKKFDLSPPEASKQKLVSDFSALSISLPQADQLRIHYQGLVGLRNLGNSCYMNSILQCLSRLIPVLSSTSLLQRSDLNPFSKSEGKLAWAFKDFLETMHKSENHKVIDPSEIKKIISRNYPQFAGYDQHDSAEFLRYFLEAIGQDCNKITRKVQYEKMTGNIIENLEIVANRWWTYSLSIENSIVTDLFQGQQISIINCKKCKFGSVACETFLSLHLNFQDSHKAASIDDMLNGYFQETEVKSYKCENCRKRGKCRQKLFFHRFPKVLIIMVKRFLASSKGRTKLDTEVLLNEELSIDRFTNEISETPPLYKLKAISHHIGTLKLGHYYSECKQDRWYRFDDHKCTSINLPRSSSSAYILFYVANN